MNSVSVAPVLKLTVLLSHLCLLADREAIKYHRYVGQNYRWLGGWGAGHLVAIYFVIADPRTLLQMAARLVVNKRPRSGHPVARVLRQASPNTTHHDNGLIICPHAGDSHAASNSVFAHSARRSGVAAMYDQAGGAREMAHEAYLLARFEPLLE